MLTIVKWRQNVTQKFRDSIALRSKRTLKLVYLPCTKYATTTTTTKTFFNSNHLQSNDTWVYRVQNIKNRINIRSVPWMLFEGGNPSLIPKYCQVETDYKSIFNLKK